MRCSTDEVLERVRSIMSETLRVPLDEVHRDSVLTEDLGAESLDIVEIEYALSMDFKVTFYEGNVIEKLQELLSPRAIAKEDALTEFGACVMRARLPEIDAAKIRPGLSILEIPNLFTPGTYARLVAELLDSRLSACPECRGTQLTAVRPSVLVCQDCDEQIDCPRQEDVLTAWVQRFGGPQRDGNQ